MARLLRASDIYLTERCVLTSRPGSRIELHPFRSYVDRLDAYMRSHPGVGSAAMF